MGWICFGIGWNFEVETEIPIAFVSTLLPCNVTTRLYARPNGTVELIIYTFYIVFISDLFLQKESNFILNVVALSLNPWNLMLINMGRS